MPLEGSCLSHPVRADERGMLATIAQREAIVAESIMAIIETRQGERVMLPDYGIPDFVFDVADFGFASRLAYFVRQQILNYEPLVETVTIEAGEVNDEGFLEGLSNGRVAIRLTYTVRGSNRPVNLVYPVRPEPAAAPEPSEGPDMWIEVTDAVYAPPNSNATLNCHTAGNAIEIRLLDAAQIKGRRYLVRLANGTHQVTFDALPDVILGNATESVTVAYDGENWVLIEQYP